MSGSMLLILRPTSAETERVGFRSSSLPPPVRSNWVTQRTFSCRTWSSRDGDGEPEAQTSITKCDNEKKAAIEAGIEDARALTERALTALGRMMPFFEEDTALKANFGKPSSEQRELIKKRYEHVRDTLGKKVIRCTGCKAKKKGEHTCAQTTVSGSKIFICPPFGTTTCPAGPTILHEAAHNAGASKDVKPGAGGYPPRDAENNAYSYEQFPVDIRKGPPEVELKQRRPKEPIP